MQRIQAKLNNLPVSGTVTVRALSHHYLSVILHCDPQIRSYNSASRLPEHTLGKPLCEDGQDVGQEPGQDVPFPTTRADISALTHGNLNSLAAFYGVNFGGATLAARQGRLTTFLGA
jgi:hypothetical protein